MTRAHPSLIPSKLLLGLSAMVSWWDLVVGVVVSVADPVVGTLFGARRDAPDSTKSCAKH